MANEVQAMEKLVDKAAQISEKLAQILLNVLGAANANLKDWLNRENNHGEMVVAKHAAKGGEIFSTSFEKDDPNYLPFLQEFGKQKIPFLPMEQKNGSKVVLFRDTDLNRVKELTRQINYTQNREQGIEFTIPKDDPVLRECENSNIRTFLNPDPDDPKMVRATIDARDRKFMKKRLWEKLNTYPNDPGKQLGMLSFQLKADKSDWTRFMTVLQSEHIPFRGTRHKNGQVDFTYDLKDEARILDLCKAREISPRTSVDKSGMKRAGEIPKQKIKREVERS